MKCAVTTVAIGEEYQSEYAAIFRPSVERYVAKHGYDLLVFENHIGNPADRDRRVISFEPLRIPFQDTVQGYDRIMVLDVDVLISAEAPPFHALDLGTKVGVVDEWCQPTCEDRRMFQAANGLPVTARDYHRLGGFELESDAVINGGMFMCAPSLHAGVFRELVEQHVETQRSHPWGAPFEQAMLSYEIQTRNLARFLPQQWNCLWPHHRRTIRWGRAHHTDARERRADLERFRDVLDANFLVHLTGGLDHDLAFVCRNR